MDTPASGAPLAPREQELPLRERKKLRTRRALVDTALELFTERGFDHVTLDELVERVEVSKRTFFRNFTSKEDVAIAPEKEFWAAVQIRLAEHPLRDPLVETLRDVLIATLLSMPEGWEHRFLASRRIADGHPAVLAHDLAFCAHITESSLGTFSRRLGLPGAGELRARALLDFVTTAWRLGQQGWPAAGGEPTREAFADRLAEAFAAIPAALELTAPQPDGPAAG
ncbi:TetR family transcriptional regulator [Streptomonospora sediminis]